MKTPKAIIILLTCAISILFSNFAIGETDTKKVFFDDWSKDEDRGMAMHEYGQWTSPSGDFSIQYLKPNEDADMFIIKGKNNKNGNQFILGYGYRSADIKWIKINGSEVAIVDHGITTGINELLIVRPFPANDWDLIYKTPPLWGRQNLSIDHCYWTFLDIDEPSGTIRLKVAWTFSNITNDEKLNMSTERIFKIPLFYTGKPKDPREAKRP